MRYTDEQLFGKHYEQYQQLLDSSLTPREFMEWCSHTLNSLIAESVLEENWMNAEKNHLRNYRIKAIEFYQVKSGGK